jgi:putative ABC transport system substrate-binding protein
MIRRRDLVAIAGGAAAAWPLAERAQQAGMPTVGFLGSASAERDAHLVAAFRDGLRQAGFIEGRNVQLDYRWAEGRYERLPDLARDLAQRSVRVLYAFDNTATAQAAKAASSTIPVVFSIGADPVKFGLVASLNRPGGNVTGAVSLTVGMGAKRLQLLHETVPGLLAMLVNPRNPNAVSETEEIRAAAKGLGRDVLIAEASSEDAIDLAFSRIAQQRAAGLLIQSEPFLGSRREQIAALAGRYRLPAIDAYREFVLAGGLMSYGASLAEAKRIAGSYVGRILKGEKPADLPVQQSTKIELVLNLKTAKALGIDMPTALLVRADEVIE